MAPLAAAMFVVFASAVARAQTDTPSPPPAPWVHAGDVLKATDEDVGKNGIRGIADHVADLEQALTDGRQVFAQPSAADGSSVVLTDGAAETLIALAVASSDKRAGADKSRVSAIANPYPMISLFLGSYYNETGKFDDAVRVLDEGLSLSPSPDLRLGEHVPYLLGERGAAYAALRRWDDSLASYDEGLKIAAMPDSARARLFRGRGYALTELGRLDEAEEAYNNSLKLEPGNQLAQHELQYIAQLRAGGLKEPPGGLMLTNPPGPR